MVQRESVFPWEHAAVAYLCYSVASRAIDGTPPSDWPVLVVLAASQFPDVIDKPLAWYVGVFPSGRSVAHSVFVAVPLVLAALLLARRRGRPDVGLAAGIGYLSHLVTDVVPRHPSGDASVESVLWPVATMRESEPNPELLALLFDGLTTQFRTVATLELAWGAVLGVCLVAGGGVLWHVDGRPGSGPTRSLVHRSRLFLRRRVQNS